MPIILQNLNKVLGTPPNQILKDINLTIDDGEFTALTGRSGSGKSSLLYVISTLDQASSGDVIIDDLNMMGADAAQIHRFRNQMMGFVFQFHYLLPELTALENVLMPAMKQRRQKDYEKRALELLHEFGLEDKVNRQPGQLSGGEQQRVAIARALVMSPKYLFADEPTGNLDSTNGEIVLDLFKKINAELKTTIIFVTHDAGFAGYARRQVQMVDGRIANAVSANS